MESIKDRKIYTARMAQTVFDKVWWLDKIDESIDTVVDFGCADGAVFEFLERITPDRFKHYIGIDIDSEMRTKSYIKSINGGYSEKIWLRSTLREALNEKLFDGSRAVLVMNSVIHELLSYHTKETLDLISKSIKNAKFAAIAIRDMEASYPEYCDESWVRATVNLIYRKSELQDLFKNHYTLYRPGLGKNPSDKELKANMVKEFLLKYRYTENWAREVRETYLWRIRTLVAERLEDYDFSWVHSYWIPWIWNRVEEDIGAVEPIPTHVQILLERKDENENE